MAEQEDPGVVRQRAAIDRTAGAFGGLVLGALAAATMGPAGLVVGPALGATSAPWLEELSHYARIAVGRRAEKVRRAVAEAGDITGMKEHELFGVILVDDKLTELANRVIEAAATSSFEQKILTLGRALGRAVAEQDRARVDAEMVLVDAISKIEVAHLRVLMVLASERPMEMTPSVQSTPTNYDVSGKPDSWAFSWTDDQLRIADPGLVDVSGVLTAQLVSLGMARHPISGGYAPSDSAWITDFGRTCLGYLAERGK